MTIVTDDRIVEAIRDLTAQYGYPPTKRELAGFLGYSVSGSGGGVSSVQYRIARLSEIGRVTFVPGKGRTIRAVEAAE